MLRHNWSVSEGQAVMREAQAWGLLGWDALHGLSAPWREDGDDDDSDGTRMFM